MLRIVEFAKTQYQRLKTHLRHQTRTGEYWQPRCYTGDSHWGARRHEPRHGGSPERY